MLCPPRRPLTPPLPTLPSQEAFDEAVSSNIEDFDMSREEAIKSAIEEFKVQGYDLSGVVTDLAGTEMDSHPVALAVQALRRAADGEGPLPEALDALDARFKVAAAACVLVRGLPCAYRVRVRKLHGLLFTGRTPA